MDKRTDKILRSMMFVPAHQERLLESAASSDADALILDLEDAVPTDKHRELARHLIQEHVEAGAFSDFSVFVRVNERESGHLLRDLDALMLDGVNGFVYPKAFSSEDIFFFDKLLDAMEIERGHDRGRFEIVPLVETPSAALNAEDLCTASERVIALAFGCEDFLSDLEGTHTEAEDSLFVPRAMVALAARAHGVLPIDTVYVDVHDLDGFDEGVRLARSLGYEGSLILHPKQIPIAHEHYSPQPDEVERARRLVAGAEAAKKQGKGVAMIDGEFIGPPLVSAAKNVLDRARRLEKNGGESG